MCSIFVFGIYASSMEKLAIRKGSNQSLLGFHVLIKIHYYQVIPLICRKEILQIILHETSAEHVRAEL